MASPLPSHRPRPITRPSGGALANDESDAAPNRRTSESDRARYPGPAAATCLTPAHHQAGPPARLRLSHSAPILLRATPRRPNLAPSPELGVHGQLLHQRYRGRLMSPVPPYGCCQIPPARSALLSLRPGHGIPIHPPSHSSPAQVQSGLSLARSLSLFPAQVLSMDGLDGLMRDFFSLVLRTLPT